MMGGICLRLSTTSTRSVPLDSSQSASATVVTPNSPSNPPANNVKMHPGSEVEAKAVAVSYSTPNSHTECAVCE